MTLLALLAACGPPADPGGRPPGGSAPADQDTSGGSPLPTFTFGPLVFAGEGPPANVLVVSIDTLRRDALSRWGSAGGAPFLDRLASEGVLLEDHVQCSNWTFASMSCTTLGRPGLDLGWLPQIVEAGREVMPPADTLPSLLRDRAGFFTVANSLNGWFSDEWGTLQGYQVRMGSGPGAEGQLRAVGDRLAQAIADGAPRWLAHVHVVEPHAAYAPPEAYLAGLDALDPIPWDLSDHQTHYEATRSWPALTPEQRALLLAHLEVRYAGEVRYLDDQLARGFADLDARGLLDDALVVIYNDHGEAFWEHGEQSHAYRLHGEETDGIAIFWGKTLAAGAWAGPTHAVDLAATLLALHGVEPAPGMSGIPLGSAPADRVRHQFTAGRLGVIQAVSQGPLKLHFRWRDGNLALYDRVADPGELVDLAAARPADVAALWALLRPEVEAFDAVLAEAPLLPEVP